jgi:hypothetical protein
MFIIVAIGLNPAVLYFVVLYRLFQARLIWIRITTERDRLVVVRSTTLQIVLTAITTKTTGQQKARMTLVSGSGYNLPRGRASRAGMTIRNR